MPPLVFSVASFGNRIREFLPDLLINTAQLCALHSHFGLLNRWNERMDLTSVVTPEEIVSRHYCESLFFAQGLPGSSGTLRILDFGSGAGFPGLPMAVLHPEWQVTLLEANQRRAVFLKEACRQLANVSVVAERGEQIHEKFDWVVARAVRSTEVLNCVPRVADHVGLLVSEGLVAGLRKTGCKWADVVRIPWSQSKCCLYGQCST